MKLTFTLLLLFTLLSCVKEKEEQKVEYFAEYIINDVVQHQTGFCLISSNNVFGLIDVHCYTLDDFEQLRETLSFYNISYTKTKIPLSYIELGTAKSDSTSSVVLYTSEGDAGTECYEIFQKENFENYIEVQSVSVDSSIITANFQFALKISEDCTQTSFNEYPDTLLISDGSLKAQRK